MMTELVVIALISNTAAIIVAAISASKKLDHITVLTNSSHQAAMERIESLEKQLQAAKK